MKTLRSANTVEATPERTGKCRSTAEEPVPARIRRRKDEGAAVKAMAKPTILVTGEDIAGEMQVLKVG